MSSKKKRPVASGHGHHGALNNKAQAHLPSVIVRRLPLGVDKASLIDWVAQRVQKPDCVHIVESKTGTGCHAFVRFTSLQKAVTASCQLDNKVFMGAPIRCELTHEFRDTVRFSKDTFSVDDRKCSITARKTMTAFLEKWSCGDFESYHDMVENIAKYPGRVNAQFSPQHSSAVNDPIGFSMPAYMGTVPQEILTDNRLSLISPRHRPAPTSPARSHRNSSRSSASADDCSSESSWMPMALRKGDSS